MRKIIIDTDTASDDAVTIIMALRHPDIEVLALTCIAGNVSMDTACKNAAIAAHFADTYMPPIYRGCESPILNRSTGGFDLKVNGFSGYEFDVPVAAPQQKHAVNAIIDTVRQSDGSVEIVALGPLTNIALALKKAPDIVDKIPRIVMMGGAGLGSGEKTPVAEANIWTDAEAAKIVLASGIPIVLLPLEACYGESVIDENDQQVLAAFGTPRADFMLRASEQLRALNLRLHGHPWISMPDPTAVAVLIDPNLVKDAVRCKVHVDICGRHTYGQTVLDTTVPEEEKTSLFVHTLHGAQFKQLMFDLLK